MLRKSQIWVDTSAQCPFKKLDFGNSSLKPRKGRYKTFLVLSNFTGFFYLVPNTLSEILDDVSNNLNGTCAIYKNINFCIGRLSTSNEIRAYYFLTTLALILQFIVMMP